MAIALPFALSLCLYLSLSVSLIILRRKRTKAGLPKNELEKLYFDNLLAWSSLTSGNKSSPRASDKDLEFFPCSFYLGMYMDSCQKYPGGVTLRLASVFCTSAVAYPCNMVAYSSGYTICYYCCVIAVVVFGIGKEWLDL
ncbi:hypothetical protein K457DRAFT_120651 [Linnemannia elongata AG-77]|uniref:Uncharacterized protein n=1 Tax=Linnemannia elongata AG-77 TaxID=1314771 RepID=A0A197KEF5_9FUNG|nr:hypothetical protein K457DRAFT_120651 [Linnemannia elongata AG-77]